MQDASADKRAGVGPVRESQGESQFDAPASGSDGLEPTTGRDEKGARSMLVDATAGVECFKQTQRRPPALTHDFNAVPRPYSGRRFSQTSPARGNTVDAASNLHSAPTSPAKGSAFSGYAWHRPSLNDGRNNTIGPAYAAKKLLWIDFIRLQPSVPVGALAAAKKDERHALLNVEVAHSTGYSDASSTMNRLPTNPLGFVASGGRGDSPGLI